MLTYVLCKLIDFQAHRDTFIQSISIYSTCLIFFLRTTAIRGSALRMKPTSTMALQTIFLQEVQLTPFYRNANLQFLYRLCTFCKYFSPHDRAFCLKTCSYMLSILSPSSFKQQGFPSLRCSIIICSFLHDKETNKT